MSRSELRKFQNKIKQEQKYDRKKRKEENAKRFRKDGDASGKSGYKKVTTEFNSVS